MRKVSTIALLFSQLWGASLFAQSYYEVTPINGNLELNSLNNKGQATGTDKSSFYAACIWEDGKIFDIPGTEYGGGYDINSRGDVCGSHNPQSKEIAFLYQDGQLHTIQSVYGQFAAAYGINDFGWITGTIDYQLNVRHVFLYHDGTLIDLGPFGDFGKGMAINNSGWIVGYGEDSNGLEQPFIFKGSSLEPLKLLPEATQGEAVDINDAGIACGFNTIGLAVAVIWDSTGKVIALPKMPGQISSSAASINNKGDIVGKVVFYQTTLVPRAAIWKNNTVRLLDELVNPDLGLTFDEAIAINDTGQVLCVSRASGKTTYYLLSPPHSEFVVNESGDESDANLADGACDVDPSQSGNQCTLRAAIEQAIYNGGGASITFDIPDNGVPVITPDSALPQINFTMTIDATTQPRSGLVELKGNKAGTGANGFTITASNSSIKGFVINEFEGYGIMLDGATNDTISACLIGTDPTGTEAKPNVMGGILVHNSMNNVIGGSSVADRNIISGNGISGQPRGHGVLIEGKQSTGNRIVGNIIGANIDGTEALPNKAGVTIKSASANQVGGSTQTPGAPPGNLISGNSAWGIAIGSESGGLSASANKIMGNLIGTNLSGTDSLSGQRIGIWLNSKADSNVIGGMTAKEKNVISGNSLTGIIISSQSSDLASNNQVLNNFIGVSANGHRSIGNDNFGIFISDSPNNVIGGKISNVRNVITGNRGIQVFIAGKNATGNKVAGNFIGVYSDGTSIPDTLSLGPGVFVSSASKTLIGGESADEGNIISGNKFGIILERSHHNIIAGNKIGTDISGNAALGNQDKPGIALFRASDNVIGGISSTRRNLISGNAAGIFLVTDQSDLFASAGDFSIGNEPAQSSDAHEYLNKLYEAQQQIKDYAENAMRQIPFLRDAELEDVKFQGNSINALNNSTLKTENNKIIGNYIGTTDSGLDSLGNREVGIFIGPGANRNDIGGLLPVERNVISSNGRGITLFRADNCKVINNLIGTGKDKTTPLPNLHDGIQILKGKRNYIGLGRVDAGNLISYNHDSNILLNGSRDNFIILNKIQNSNKGVAIFKAYNDQILSNRIWYNQTGISSDGSDVILKGNSIKDNSGTSTGIHFSSSSGEIAGNWIENNSGGGIRLDNGSQPLIRFNNLLGNQGYGVNNTTSGISVDARNNWWGEASGPGGAGQGSGDAVSGGVNFSGWLSAPVSVVVAPGADTLYARIGTSDSTIIAFQNWDDPSDVLDVNVKESSGGLRSPTQHTVQLDPGAGGGMVLRFEVPGNANPGEVEWVVISAVSQSNPNNMAVDSVLIYPYNSVLTNIGIFPDSVTVSPHHSYQFSAVGYDQHGETTQLQPDWSAAYGSIDTSGFYTAPGFAVIDTVRAMDTTMKIVGQAIVYVNGPTSIRDTKSLLPSQYELFQNYPNPFNPTTVIGFVLPKNSRVELEISNILGERVATLVNGEMNAGYHEVVFDASQLASGIYIYRITANHFVQVKKMILLR